MEALIAILLVALSAAGLALGLMAGRGPLRRGCDGLACVGSKRCDACPGRKENVQ
jgi:hypothetical protein